MSLPIRKTFRATGGLNLSYLQWKPQSEPEVGLEPVLLLHGMADHAGVWAEFGTALSQASDRYQILAPDLRGHGESDKPERGYGFGDVIADLTDLMDHQGWQSAHILGHSWTGKMVAVWARQAPERFRSLILVDPVFIGSLPSWTKLTFPVFYRLLPFLKMLGPFEDKAAAEAQAKQLKQYRDWTILQQQVFEAAVEQKADGSWSSKFTIAAREPMFEDVMRVPGFTQTIDIPALLIQPTDGINRSERQLKPYRKYLSHLEICTLATSHWPFLTAPAEFEATIVQFLAQDLGLHHQN